MLDSVEGMGSRSVIIRPFNRVRRAILSVIALSWTLTTSADPTGDEAFSTLATIEQAAAEAYGPQGDVWLERVRTQRSRFERGLDWMIENKRGEEALRFASALTVFWRRFGDIAHARERLNTALALPNAAAPTPARAKALYDAGLLAFRQNDEAESLARNKESLAIGERLGDKATMQLALIGLSRVALRRHDYGGVRQNAEQALGLAQQRDDKEGELRAVHMLAAASRMSDDTVNAAKYYEYTLATYAAQDDREGVAGELMNLGCVHLHRHDPDWALRLFKESVAVYRSLKSELGLAFNIGGLAGVAAERHEWLRAAQLFGSLDAAMKRLAIVLDPDDQLDRDRYFAMARGHISSTAFGAAYTDGQTMSISDAIALGLGESN